MSANPVTDARTLVGLRRSELGTLFRAGGTTVPSGRGRGTVLIGTGGALARLAAALAYALWWRGKVVDGAAGRLKNLLTPLAIPGVVARVYEGTSWYDDGRCVVLDYSATSWVARKVRDEIREVGPGVFLGVVFLGRRHVLDFALDFNAGDGGVSRTRRPR